MAYVILQNGHVHWPPLVFLSRPPVDYSEPLMMHDLAVDLLTIAELPGPGISVIRGYHRAKGQGKQRLRAK